MNRLVNKQQPTSDDKEMSTDLQGPARIQMKLFGGGESPLYQAVGEGDGAAISRLLGTVKGRSQIYFRNTAGETPFSLAVEKGYTYIVKLFLKYPGVNLRSDAFLEGYTPLHIAVREGHKHVVELLVNHIVAKGELELLQVKDSTSLKAPPLFYAFNDTNFEIAECLINAGATLEGDPSWFTLLLQVVFQKGSHELQQLLLRTKISFLEGASSAISSRNMEKLRLFLLHKDVPDRVLNTALSGALEVSDLEMAVALVERGAAVNSVHENLSVTPLYLAVEVGDIEIVSRLLQLGAAPNLSLEDGSSPLLLASLLRRQDIVKLLKQHGADLGDLPDNRFKIYRDKKLGSGSFGSVFEAVDEKLSNRFLAVKEQSFQETTVDAIAKYEKATSWDEKQNYLSAISGFQEFDLLQKLRHERIVRVYHFDYDKSEMVIRIFMELVEGGSVEKYIQDKNEGFRLHEDRIRQILLDVLEALSYLHGEHILHRDIKPANILLGLDMRAKVSDFGLSKKVDEEGQSFVHLFSFGRKKWHSPAGTLHYMSPDKLEHRRDSVSSDLHALGLSVLRMANEKGLWNGAISSEILNNKNKKVFVDAVLQLPTPHPPIPDHLSEAMKDILLKLFDLDPEAPLNGEKTKELFQLAQRAFLETESKESLDEYTEHLECWQSEDARKQRWKQGKKTKQLEVGSK